MHTAYDVSTDGQSSSTQACTYTVFNTVNNKTLSSVQVSRTTITKAGIFRRSRLDASHHTVKNAAGWRPPTSYYGSRFKSEVHFKSGSVRCLNTTWKYLWKWDNVVNAEWVQYPETSINATSPSSLVTGLVVEAKTKALNKLRRAGMDEGLDLSVAFAERRKTVGLVTETVETLADAAYKVRTGHMSAAAQVLTGLVHRGSSIRSVVRNAREMGNRWLELRYGWTPLLADVYGACETLAYLDSGSYTRYRIKATSNRTISKVENNTSSCYLRLPNYLLAGKSDRCTETKGNCKVVLYCSRSNDAYVHLADVGVTDPLSTAWELLPYSFVVDWFFGVGDALSANSAMQGYSLDGGSVTCFESKTVKYSGRLSTPSTLPVQAQAGIEGLFREDHLNVFTRAVLTEDDLSVPIFTLNRDFFKVKRLFDALALFSNALTKFGR